MLSFLLASYNWIIAQPNVFNKIIENISSSSMSLRKVEDIYATNNFKIKNIHEGSTQFYFNPDGKKSN